MSRAVDCRVRTRAAHPRGDRRLIISLATRLLLAAYFLEAGLILIIAPWSAFWDRNFFAAVHPLLDSVFVSPYVRGAVSGVGVITVFAGLAELAGAFTARREASGAQPGQTLPFDR